MQEDVLKFFKFNDINDEQFANIWFKSVIFNVSNELKSKDNKELHPRNI